MIAKILETRGNCHFQFPVNCHFEVLLKLFTYNIQKPIKQNYCDDSSTTIVMIL